MKAYLITSIAIGISAVTTYAQDDADKFLGTWKVISAEDSGRKAAKGEILDMKWVITKERISVQRGKFTNASVYKIDPSKSPKWLDIEEGDHISKAIYELKGDQLKVCVSEKRELGRPTALESKPDSVNDVLITLERVDEKEASTPAKPTEEAETLADPADVPKGMESLKLSNEQAAKINVWLEKQGDTIKPSDLAKFVKAQLRKDQQEAFRKLLEAGGAP